MADNERDVRDLWQNQITEGFRMTPGEIEMKVQELDSRLRRRTYGAYVVCAFLIVAFSLWAVAEQDLMMRLGAAATIVAVAYLAYQVHQNRFREDPPSAMAAKSVDHLRGELQRQRDFHRGRQFWSRMLPLSSAGLLFLFGFARAHPEVVGTIRIEIVTLIVFIAAAIPLNLWLARKYQDQIDELDRQTPVEDRRPRLS